MGNDTSERFTLSRYAGILRRLKENADVRPETGVASAQPSSQPLRSRTLCQVNPELRQFLTLTPAGSVDFANPLAVKALNKALLAHFYAVANWHIPARFSCSPVPGRADHIHHLADLLAEASGTIPANASILDIGVGANCIYPLIGVHEYGWRFTGSETSSQALSSAQAIISANPGLTAPFVCVGKKRVGRFLTASSIKTSNTTRPCVTRHCTISPLRRGQVVSDAVTWG